MIRCHIDAECKYSAAVRGSNGDAGVAHITQHSDLDQFEKQLLGYVPVIAELKFWVYVPTGAGIFQQSVSKRMRPFMTSIAVGKDGVPPPVVPQAKHVMRIEAAPLKMNSCLDTGSKCWVIVQGWGQFLGWQTVDGPMNLQIEINIQAYSGSAADVRIPCCRFEVLGLRAARRLGEPASVGSHAALHDQHCRGQGRRAPPVPQEPSPHA